LAFYAGIPSYAKVLEREGVDQAGELAAVGPADAVRKQLQRYLDAGATDLVLSPVRSNSADPELLWQVAASI
jgi:alkanesulfonate monooxygenase SsuD/methylene tetrahydromethanopterin reductase-like flavin-dependent oxidoreductase (luciferase family)